jgi:F-type H+-transporting ATPase subunit b
MRKRTILSAVVLAMTLVVGAPSVASAATESVGACIVDHTEKLLASGGNPNDPALRKQVETDAEACQKAPNPILPATNEIIWGTLSFAILLFVLWKFALPPVRKTMEARSERIRNDLAQAEAARAEAEAVLAHYQQQVAEAQGEAQRIIEEARQTAAALRADLQRRAEEEIAEMRRRAQAEVEAAKQQAIAELRSEVATLALAAAERVVERSLDRETQLQLIENYINQVGSAR